MRESKVTSPTSIEVVTIPDMERVAEAQKRAAPGYRRALLKKLKEQAEEPEERGQMDAKTG